jgi:hypothetical protein
MQPGTTIFELQVPEPIGEGNGRLGLRFNEIYHTMSLTRGLIHLSLYCENAQEFAEIIKNNSLLNKILR